MSHSNLQFIVVGAGAMGGSYGAKLAQWGAAVQLIDRDPIHMEAVHGRGLHFTEGEDSHRLDLAISTLESYTGPAGDVVIVFVDSNATREVSEHLLRLLTPTGYAVSFQNGVGNLETLVEVLGAERVMGGSSMCSAAMSAPGAVALTHVGPSTVGELDGGSSPRARDLAETLTAAGLPTKVAADIKAVVWQKFLLNCAVNPLCAITGLRLGEIVRLRELDALQDHLIAEALAVTEAKGIRLPGPDVATTIKTQCRAKFSRPSMLQHVEAGRRTEIDAINGALVREGRALGIPTPYNEAVVALLKGREQKRRREVHEPDLDYTLWERGVAAGSGDCPSRF